jgi:hypothetical protein
MNPPPDEIERKQFDENTKLQYFFRKTLTGSAVRTKYKNSYGIHGNKSNFDTFIYMMFNHFCLCVSLFKIFDKI